MSATVDADLYLVLLGLKSTGQSKLSFHSFPANQAWTMLAVLAFNLTAWLQLVCLPTRHRAAFWDIKRWRYRVFATAGKLITTASRHRLLLPESAPEKELINLILKPITALKHFKPG
ncbi:hypothetical protein BJ994_001705 [Arthrobacter pigmenti]|uniref:Transposase DDE domain-containing protein n=1 Tax=Arthrobacter pigmenti TaxID=271432 RepID=A0A846RNG5_9MICC|nr:hypothetical protein [Arthrobacter pigmenti]